LNSGLLINVLYNNDPDLIMSVLAYF